MTRKILQMNEDLGDTRPWESSVVSALREAQWLRYKMRLQETGEATPGAFFTLKGDSEEFLGDVVVGISDRFYLLEAKANPSCFKTEWSKKHPDGSSYEKLAFQSLHALAKNWAENRQDDWLDYWVWSSMRCHQFLCWSKEVFDPLDRLGRIVAYPYLLACARLAPDMPRAIFSRFKTAEQSKDQSRYALDEFVTASVLLDGRGLIFETDSENTETIFQNAAMGLPFDDFKLYTDFLTRAGSIGGWMEAPLNAVICTNGGYIRHVTSFVDLKAALTVTNAVTPNVVQDRRPTVDRAMFSKSVARTDAKPACRPAPTFTPSRWKN